MVQLLTFTISTTQTNEDKRNRHIYLPQPKKSKPGSTTRRARWDFPSRIVQETVVQQPTDGLYAYAVNFKMAVTLCKEFLNKSNMTGKEVMQKISRHTVPIRPGRQDERNLRVKGFGWFTYRIAA